MAVQEMIHLEYMTVSMVSVTVVGPLMVFFCSVMVSNVANTGPVTPERTPGQRLWRWLDVGHGFHIFSHISHDYIMYILQCGPPSGFRDMCLITVNFQDSFCFTEYQTTPMTMNMVASMPSMLQQSAILALRSPSVLSPSRNAIWA